MQVSTAGETDGEVETVLSGRFADQATLMGVLSMLYELHLPVLSVECVDSETEAIERPKSQQE